MQTEPGIAEPVYQGGTFRLEQCRSCPVPGYLILALREPVRSLADLDPERSRLLGPFLSRATRAIERVVDAERVYCLLFGEELAEVHFHLFPRTRWLLDAYRQACPGQHHPYSGPSLFHWARESFLPGIPLPDDAPDLADTCNRLRADLLDFGDAITG